MDETCPILYSSSQRKGVIEPNSVKEVPLFIEAQGLEELSVNAFFMIVGSQEAPLVSCAFSQQLLSLVSWNFVASQ